MASNVGLVPIEDATNNPSVVIREDTTNTKNSLKDSPTLSENMMSVESSVLNSSESFTASSLERSLERKEKEKADAVTPDVADASSAVPLLSGDTPEDDFLIERETSQNDLVFDLDVDVNASSAPAKPSSKEPEPITPPVESILSKVTEPSSPAEKPTLVSAGEDEPPREFEVRTELPKEEEKEEDHLLDEIETALSKETPEELQLSKARQSLILANESHSQATQKVLDDANEYAKNVDSDLSKLARDVQMISSKAWYNFWQTATRIPKDSKYATVTGEKVPWKDIVKKNENLLREIVAEQDGWKKVSNADSVKVETSPLRSKGTKLYKLTTTLSVSPKVALLPLVRGPLLGKTDNDLIYFREHYNFVGGMTSLVHTIRTVLPYERVQVRDFFDLTNWIEDADGSVWYTAQSVTALPLIRSTEPKITRGSTMFYGFNAKPNEVGGSEVTVIVQVRLNGWVPNIVMDWRFPTVLVGQVKALEKAAKAVRETGEEERFVRKFLYRELDVGDVPAIVV